MSNMSNIDVTVIIPFYNAEKHLENCLKSVLSQTQVALEVICVNDGSRDSSAAVVKRFAEKDSRITLIEQENKGSGPARNLGISLAKGKYIAFMDSDDFYPSDDVLCKLYNNAVTNNVKISGGSFSRFQQRTIQQNFSDDLLPYIFDHEGIIDYSDYQFDYGYHRFLYSSALLRENNIQFPELKRFQDVPFMVDAMIAAQKFYAIPDITYCYRKEKNRKKPLDWESNKFRDVLKGITQNLVRSKNNNLARLHCRTYKHFIEPQYWEVLKRALDRHNYETLKLVRPLWNAISREMLTQEGVDIPKDVEELVEEIEICLQNHESFLQNGKRPEEEIVSVTVIMPSLNVEPYITKCLESVINQTGVGIEILCIDAGSTDGTLEIIEAFSKIDHRIRIIHSDKKSYGYQVNLGIKAARGKYLGIVETDDYIEDSMYQTIFQAAEENNADVVKADYWKVHGYGDNLLEERTRIVDKTCYNKVLRPKEVKEVYTSLRPMYIWAGLYNVQFLRDNNIYANESSGASFQDNGFWMQVLIHSSRMFFLRQPFYHLRRDNPSSSTSSLPVSKIHCMKNEYDFIRGIIDGLTDDQEKDLFVHLCALFRFKNYMFTYTRLPEKMKLEYLKEISSEFIRLEETRELEKEFFTVRDWVRITSIMDDPEEHYNSKLKNIRELPTEVRQLKNQIAELNNQIAELQKIKESKEYTIGTAVTWLPRKMKKKLRKIKRKMIKKLRIIKGRIQGAAKE